MDLPPHPHESRSPESDCDDVAKMTKARHNKVISAKHAMPSAAYAWRWHTSLSGRWKLVERSAVVELYVVRIDGSSYPAAWMPYSARNVAIVTPILTFGSLIPGSPTRVRVSVMRYTMFMMTVASTIVGPAIHWLITSSVPLG